MSSLMIFLFGVETGFIIYRVVEIIYNMKHLSN